jgi:hypothetical protein
MSKTKIASPVEKLDETSPTDQSFCQTPEVDLKIPENADSSKSFSVDKESVGEASAVKHFSIFHIIL